MLTKGATVDSSVHPVSDRPVYGMALSTGNIYFTTNDTSGAHVFRTGQTSSPGQELELYGEPSGSWFGDIIWAKAGGVHYGYFWVFSGENSVVKRIPLTGSATAEVLTPPIGNVDIVDSHHNLATDGVSLYWQSAESVNKSPIGGGHFTALDLTSPNIFTAGVYLNGRNLIYADAAELRYVPANGIAVTPPWIRTIVTAVTEVTTIMPVSNGVYWGERTGAIRVKAGSAISTIAPAGHAIPTSIATSGNAVGGPVIWTLGGSQSSDVGFDGPGGQGSLAAGADAVGASMNSAGNAFWGDANGVHRFCPQPGIARFGHLHTNCIPPPYHLNPEKRGRDHARGEWGDAASGRAGAGI